MKLTEKVSAILTTLKVRMVNIEKAEIEAHNNKNYTDAIIMHARWEEANTCKNMLEETLR